jgi:hypothetical protein
MIRKIHFPGLNDYTVHIEICEDIFKAMQKYPPTANHWHPEGTDACTMISKKQNMAYVFLPIDVRAGTLAHEIWHVVRDMFIAIEATLEDELIAYHLGYLVDETTELIRRAKNAKKTKTR